jgi:ubiquinone biosynthesis protein UbiJ
MTPAWPSAFAPLNHLIAAEPWARLRMQACAGTRIRFRAVPLPDLHAIVALDGRLERDASPELPNATVTISPQAPFALLRSREAFVTALRVDGDAALVDTLNTLLAHVRWDFEDELARVVGDIAARRVAQTIELLRTWQRDGAERLAQNVADYIAEEQRWIASRAQLERLAAEAAASEQALAALEARVARIESRLPAV